MIIIVSVRYVPSSWYATSGCGQMNDECGVCHAEAQEC